MVTLTMWFSALEQIFNSNVEKFTAVDWKPQTAALDFKQSFF